MGKMKGLRGQLGLGGRQSAQEAMAADDSEEVVGVDVVPAQPRRQGWLKRRQEMKRLTGDFNSYPHLLALKPKEGYVFRSDYFEIDSEVACVLAYFHDEAAADGFAPFWGIDRIPDGLDKSVTAVVLEKIARKDDKWVDQYTKQSEQLGRLDKNESDESGTTSAKRKVEKNASDLDIVTGELQNGASYLTVHSRVLLKAPDLETLEESIERLKRLYIDRFGTIRVAPYAAEQRQELSNVWSPVDRMRGKGFGFTSTELAGSYSLVTNGLNDRDGEYVGIMVGDVNNSAVVMKVNGYGHHVVIANSEVSELELLERERISSMWCSKISQAALLHNHRVVHLVLDGAQLDKLGPKFERLTSRIDMNSGDVNMFEMFGDESDELAIFSVQMEKLKLMFDQFYEAGNGSISAITRGALEQIATDFYIDQRMWAHNAKDNRSRLRVVGIPHEQVPLLHMFSAYVETAYKALSVSTSKDQDQVRALNVIRNTVQTMLSTNGELFNNITASTIDGVRDSRRVVYDFSELLRRGRGVAMAQLVNIVGFAVGTLGAGDVVIIHGTENIDDGVKKYLEQQFEHLYTRGGRIVYSYNDVDKMLDDASFNRFDAADYTLLGAMRDKTVSTYQDKLGQQIPPDLEQLITTRGENYTYLRRGVSNVVFWVDLPLGVNPEREAERRRFEMEARDAEREAQMLALMNDDITPGAHSTSVRQHGAAVVDDDETGQASVKRSGTRASRGGRAKKKQLPTPEATENPSAKKLARR